MCSHTRGYAVHFTLNILELASKENFIKRQKQFLENTEVIFFRFDYIFVNKSYYVTFLEVLKLVVWFRFYVIRIRKF